MCLGCMMFGGRTSATDSYDIIDRSLDAGINFLDTANVYSIGRSEEATAAYSRALELAPSETERTFLRSRVTASRPR